MNRPPDIIVNSFDDLLNLKKIQMIVVYEHPQDFPDKFIARLWEIEPGNPIPRQYIMVKDTLAQIREEIPPYMWNLGRRDYDDPVIAEVWM